MSVFDFGVDLLLGRARHVIMGAVSLLCLMLQYKSISNLLGFIARPSEPQVSTHL